jgi:tetratricopeptide (TPR) repeat protein
MNRFGYIACLFLTVTFTLSVFSQDENDQKSFNKAEKHLQSGEYAEALPLYLSILESFPDNSNFNYRVGKCYMNLLGQERKALPHLQKAVLEIDENYKSGNFKKTGAAPEAWLLLGDAFHRDEMLDEASLAYHRYKEYVQDDRKELDQVSERIISLGVSQGEVRDHPADVILSNLGNKVNSKSSEYNIVYSGDEKTMVFTRYEKRKDVIFVSFKREGAWTDPVDISSQIGSQGDMYATALSYDGTELYLILLTPYDADIYISKYNGSEWSYADNIGRSINSKYVESNASISADGNTLYFSSDRASSIGGFDIFYSTRENGKWSKAENLGEVINTKANEESPFITNSGNTLYFSSDRPGTIGRMDIYYSRLSSGSWTQPENLGMPYNSVDDDISFKYYEKYRKGYIARDLPGGFGKLDLYMVQSGTDRQREISDYMASLRPPEPEKEEAPVTEVLEEQAEVTEIPEEVPAVAAAAVIATATIPEKMEPEPIEKEESAEVEVMAVVEETEPEPDPEPKTVLEPEPEPVVQVVAEEPKPEIEPVNTLLLSEEGVYTIQVLALIFPKDDKQLQGLDNSLVRRIEGNDGYTRFIYGRYATKKEAIKALRQTFAKGYEDAFIRKTSDINNFQ